MVSMVSLLEKDLVTCGPNWKEAEDSRCVALRDCGKDVTPHLKMCKVVDLRIENESQLLLSSAGNSDSSL